MGCEWGVGYTVENRSACLLTGLNNGNDDEIYEMEQLPNTSPEESDQVKVVMVMELHKMKLTRSE